VGIIRTRFALRSFDKYHYSSAIKDFYKKEGILSFYKGLKTHLIGAMVYKGYGFFFYENTKKQILNNQYIGNRSFLIFFSGSMSGMFAQMLSYPFDVIKKKLQAKQEQTTQ
jgi:hypothetical protein